MAPMIHSQALDHLRALCRHGRFEEAVAQAERLLETRPEDFDLWHLLGGACTRTGRIARAEAAFRRAVAIRPEHAGTQYNLGLVLHRTGRLQEAIKAYRKALRRAPDHAGAWNNLGNALADLGRTEEAETALRQALRHRPDDADALSNLGRVLEAQDRPEEAIAAWTRALKLRPDHAAALSQKLILQWEGCDFRAHAEVAQVLTTLGISGARVPPFALLAAEDHPARQRRRSERWAQEIPRVRVPAPRPPPDRRPERLRIGYFSACFHDHPWLRLAGGLLREHDRSRFEIFAYSYGRQRTGNLRAEVQRTVPEFHDVEHLSPGEIAEFARSHRLDIAIDHDGYTRNARPDILACRPAAIAISFLGYPGTTGAGFIDYLVADPIVIPPAERAHYSERVIFLPDSYQPGDDRQRIADTTDTRADHGLPERGFVFCCFNNGRKIGPDVFDIWMRLLHRVDGSVLWLLRSNRHMEANLRQEAAARGVDPDRLVFAGKCPHGAHLARQRHADLFLDTFHFNAHTTGSDALRAGLPVVAMAGRQFAARVGASLLRAAGLPDLVTGTPAEYAALALTLARDPARLAEMRARLSDARRTHPLFDTARYVRNFETGLELAFDRYLKREDPRDLIVPAETDLSAD